MVDGWMDGWMGRVSRSMISKDLIEEDAENRELVRSKIYLGSIPTLM